MWCCTGRDLTPWLQKSGVPPVRLWWQVILSFVNFCTRFKKKKKKNFSEQSNGNALEPKFLILKGEKQNTGLKRPKFCFPDLPINRNVLWDKEQYFHPLREENAYFLWRWHKILCMWRLVNYKVPHKWGYFLFYFIFLKNTRMERDRFV